MSRPIPVLLCIDVEPDGFFIDRDRAEPWRGYEQSIEFFRAWRPRLCGGGRAPARLTWTYRLDPQIEETYGAADWPLQHYARQRDELLNQGDELGIHVHAYRWNNDDRRWVIDHGNQPWVDRCVQSSFHAFGQAMGKPCVTFRFGDRWMSNDTVRTLEQLGARYDLTLEPGYQPEISNHPDEHSTGSLPDYSAVPGEPYHPSREDYRQPDPSREHGIWMIPVTTAPVRPRLLRQAYYRVFQHARRRDVWTGLLSHEPILFGRIVDHALNRASRSFLALLVRSNALAEDHLARRVEANLRTLLTHPMAERFAWVSPAEAISLLQPSPDPSVG